MIWDKHSADDRKIPGISVFAGVLVIASLYMQSELVFFLAVFFLVIVYANHLYLENIGKWFFFDNIVEKNRFFINENGKWVLSFRNEGLPILKGELVIHFDQNVSPNNRQLEPSLSMYELAIPFSLYSRQVKQITIPFTANSRGIAKIRKLEVRIPSLIGFGEVILEYKNRISQVAIVYPKPITVMGLKEHSSALQGVNVVLHSVYEDQLGPLGTRDYVSSDSFNRIHWRASARKQSLQTKVFERIAEKGWNISLNVSDGYAITADLEKLISSVTEIAYYSYQKQIPYSLCINVRTAGTTPFQYIAKGEGREHLQKVLETLASINTLNTTFPYEKMISFYNRHLAEQPFFLHGGIKTSATEAVLSSMERKGVCLLELNTKKEQVILTTLEKFERRRLL